MWTFINNWLKRPFPLITSPIEKWGVSLGVGLFVFLFLAVFQPFGIESSSAPKIHLAFSGLVATLAMLFDFFVLPFLFPKYFDESKWTIKHILIYSLIILTTVSLFNIVASLLFFVGDEVMHTESGIYFVLMWFYQTYLIGIFPTFLFIYFSERRLYNKYRQEAKKLIQNKSLDHPIQVVKETTIKLYSENKKESFEVSNEHLLYATSDSNYVSLFYLFENQVKEYIIRNTLSNIEVQMIHIPHIVRCHKSYIVNMLHVNDVSGNARGYTLHMSDYYVNVPVSRSFPKDELFRLVNK